MVSLYLLTSVIQEVSHHSDVIHISLGSSIQQYWTMYASIVEEIKVDVLHKKPIGIPVEQLHFPHYLNAHRQATVHILISPKYTHIKVEKARFSDSF